MKEGHEMFPAYCDGIDRRGFLRVGSLAGLSLAQIMRLQESRASEPMPAYPARPGKDINCIFIFIIGGMAHQDLWDTKPDAPAEIRGDFHPIHTVVPGLSVSNILPSVAGVTDSLAILRGLTH